MKKILLLLTILMTLTFTGCWDSIETEKLAVVSILGVELSDNDNFKVTVQVLSPKNQSVGTQSSGNISMIPFHVYSEEGPTISEAIQKISSSQHKDIYFGHTRIILLSEGLVRSKGFQPVLSFYGRTPEMRLENYILISKDDKLDKIMHTDTGLNSDTGTALEETISNGKNISYISALSMNDIVDMLGKPGSEPYTSGVNISGKNSNNKISIEDTAVFKKDKLIGWLNSTESRGLLFVKGNVKGGGMTINYNGEKLSLRIIRNSSKIHPVISNGKVQMNLTVNVTSYIAESHGKADFLDTNTIEKIEDIQKQEIKDEITSAINHSKSLNSDIFEFGSYVNMSYPKFWKEVKADWDSYYPDLPVNIDVRTSIRNIGIAYKTIKP